MADTTETAKAKPRRRWGFVSTKEPTYGKKPDPSEDIPTLVERTCVCGCGRKFRCVAKSPVVHASGSCPR